MLRSVITNLGFTGAAQAISLIATLVLASVMEQHDFASLAIVLSSSTIASLFLTLQIERAYVKIPRESIQRFVASHLAIISILFVIALPIAAGLPRGVEVLFISFGIALNQMTSYYSARVAYLRRVWLIKFLQAVLVACGTGVLISTKWFGWAGWMFGLAWLVPALVVLDLKVWRSLPFQRLSTLAECAGGALAISRVSLMSMTFFNVVREGPVLLAGLLHDPAAAAALGLANRVIAQPLGLLGRSVSMVLANVAATGKAHSKVSIIIVLLVGLSTSYCLAFGVAAQHLRPLESYRLLTAVTFAMTPLYVGHLAIGALGPYLIAENLFYREMWLYAFQALVCAVSGLYLWFFDGSFIAALWVISFAVVITVVPFIATIQMNIKNRRNESVIG